MWNYVKTCILEISKFPRGQFGQEFAHPPPFPTDKIATAASAMAFNVEQTIPTYI